MTWHGSTAVINIAGPIFRYANMFTRISGATSIDAVASAIGEAEATADNIIFNFDTPGGDATEISSMAERINKIKIPTVAYVGAMAASAGYWLASATDKIVVGSTGLVGSIGVIATFPKSGKNETVEIISSQSPDKRINVETDEGAAKMQALIDKMAGIFVADVARYRGVSEEKVLSDFGKGGVLIGADAVSAGMADAMGNINDLILTKSGDYKMSNLTLQERLKKLEASDSELVAHIKGSAFDEGFESASKDVETEKKAAHQEGFAAGKASELERIKGVKAQSVAGYSAEIEAMMFDGETTAEQAAVKIVRAMQDKKENVLQAIQETQEPIQDAPEQTCSAEKQWASDESLKRDFPTFESYLKYQEGVKSGRIRRVGGAKI